MTARFAHLVAIATIATPLATASGATVAYDGFSYTDIDPAVGTQTSITDAGGATTAADATTTAMNGGTGFKSGSAWAIAMDDSTRTARGTLVSGLSFGSNFASTSGSAVKIDATSSGSGSFSTLQRELTTTQTPGSSLWFGFLWQSNTGTSGTHHMIAATHSNAGNFSFSSTNGNFQPVQAQKFTVAVDGKADALDMDPFASVSTAANAQVAGSGDFALTQNSTYLTLSQITNNGAANTKLEAWTMTQAQWDTIAADGAVTVAELNANRTWYVTNTSATAVTFSGTEFAQFTGHRSSTFTIDEVRYATDAADFVPEPAALSLVGLAGLALVRRRRV